MIGFGLFLVVGIEMTVSGWFPTYAVIAAHQNKEDAALYNTYFWTV